MLRRGGRGPQVVALQEALNRLGHRYINSDDHGMVAEPLKEDGIFGAKTEAVIADFQESLNLPSDGVVGPITMGAIERAIAGQEVELASPGSDALGDAGARLPFVRVAADDRYGGFNRFWLRADVSEAYERAHEALASKGAVIPSSGARRSLNATVSPGRSALSFHYLGRALDMYIYSGMVDPDKDPFVITIPPDSEAKTEAGERWLWTVYARCQGTNARSVNETSLGPVVTYDDPRGARERSASGKFVCLTEIFAEQGLLPIPARPKFFRGGGMIYAEWWHFQYEAGLIAHVSTFGAELLKVYSEEALEGTPPWRYRNRVFGESWGFIR